MKRVEDALRWIRRVGGNTDLSDKGLIFFGCRLPGYVSGGSPFSQLQRHGKDNSTFVKNNKTLTIIAEQ